MNALAPLTLARLPAPAISISSAELATRFERGIGTPDARFYAIRVERDRQLTLNPSEPGYLVFVEHGSLPDGTPTKRIEPCATLARAVERYGALCARRRARGYAQVSEVVS